MSNVITSEQRNWQEVKAWREEERRIAERLGEKLPRYEEAEIAEFDTSTEGYQVIDVNELWIDVLLGLDD